MGSVFFIAFFYFFQVNLKSGTNILYWRTTGILVGGRTVKPVLLKNIQIEGEASNAPRDIHELYNIIALMEPPCRFFMSPQV